ncbi:MAG: amidase [Bacteroidetes bacterium HGW-Bacteroidetes-4]|jgi:amidase|nr:MAG: amidase [Bacteroidetes bacterium HGW-Bacteroidetes-4]
MKNKNLSLIIVLQLGFAIACQQPKSKIAVEPFPLEEISIMELHQRYLDQTMTVEQVVQLYLNRIEQIDKNGPELNSVIQLNPNALEIARGLDAELREGKVRGYMHGIPVLLKDNLDTHDKMSTTAGSRALISSQPLQDSWVAKKLRESGAVILGKANLSEWANFRGELSSSGWSGIGGQTKNPYVLDRNPCGSSSGSGVAVSANLCMVAIGTETNGSIVCPSHANGIVGIKPTVGLVSRSGVIPISWTQDTPGPMARNLSDAAICLAAISGVDSADTKTLAAKENVHTDYLPFLKTNGLHGKRIGLYTRALGTHFKVDALMQEAVDYLKSQGAEVIEIDQIASPEVEGWSFELMLYEYKDGLNKYFASLGEKAPIKNLDELIAFNKNDSVEMQIYNQTYLEMASEKTGLDSKAYKELLLKMEKGMRTEGIDRVMNAHQLDAIIAPTGSPAWKTDWVNGDFYQLGSSSPAAIAGYPNITVPMGFIGELPVGISFFGRAWSEPLLLEIAYTYEQGTQHRRAPGFLTK